MPELPEVETMVRGIREALVGATILQALPCPCTRKPIDISPDPSEIQRRTGGCRIRAVNRLAKRVLIELDSSDLFVIEPRMTGLMLLSDPPSTAHLRFRWDLKRGRERYALWFWDRRGLGTLRLYTLEERARLLGPRVLGPDALEMTPRLWQHSLAGTSRPIKVALLDQKRVAGIGNLYASEILHQARISPFLAANRLSEVELRRLHSATRAVLEKAIQYEGSTLADGTYRNALNQDGGYQNEHRVYGKGECLCATCRKARIVRVVQAQRSTFYCPRCQCMAPAG